MIKPTLFGLVVAAGSLALMPQAETAQGRYVSSGGQTIEGLGVCDITPEKLACWDMTGNPSPAVTDQVRQKLLGRSGVEFHGMFGKKNRYLCVRCSGAGVFPASKSDVATPLDWTGHPSLWLVNVTPSEQAKTYSLALLLYENSPTQTVKLPFREGAKASRGGFGVELGSWSKQEGWPYSGGVAIGSGIPQRWVVAMSIDGPPPNAYLYVQAFDKKGVPISAVDALGRPVPYEAYDRWLARMRDGDRTAVADRVDPAYFQRDFMTVGSAFAEVTDIDPALISALQVSVVDTKQAVIDGFPLDPKP